MKTTIRINGTLKPILIHNMLNASEYPSYTRSVINEYDLPRINEFIYHKKTQNFYKVTSVVNSRVNIWSLSNVRTSYNWKSPDSRGSFLLSNRSSMLRQVEVYQQRLIANLEDESSEKLTLIGREGKSEVLKAHALLVSAENFKAMVLRAQNNELKVELGTPALEVFSSFVTCMLLSLTKIDPVALTELLDITKMYMIDKFHEMLVDMLIPKLGTLSAEEFIPWQEALMRLPTQDYARILNSWRGVPKNDDTDKIFISLPPPKRRKRKIGSIKIVRKVHV